MKTADVTVTFWGITRVLFPLLSGILAAQVPASDINGIVARLRSGHYVPVSCRKLIKP
jgi:hypothetical protein